MVNEDSIVKDFYPINFQTDLNGKDQEWEAVVLIPFIDEGRLLEAMRPCLPHLTQEVGEAILITVYSIDLTYIPDIDL